MPTKGGGPMKTMLRQVLLLALVSALCVAHAGFGTSPHGLLP